MSKPNNHILIPVASDLVIPGNPLMKKEASEKHSAESSYIDNLNRRINELETAIGQDETTSLGRAYAIREEASRAKTSEIDLSTTESDKSDKIEE
jgi:hypothetical protein